MPGEQPGLPDATRPPDPMGVKVDGERTASLGSRRRPTDAEGVAVTRRRGPRRAPELMSWRRAADDEVTLCMDRRAKREAFVVAATPAEPGRA